MDIISKFERKIILDLFLLWSRICNRRSYEEYMWITESLYSEKIIKVEEEIVKIPPATLAIFFYYELTEKSLWRIISE